MKQGTSRAIKFISRWHVLVLLALVLVLIMFYSFIQTPCWVFDPYASNVTKEINFKPDLEANRILKGYTNSDPEKGLVSYPAKQHFKLLFPTGESYSGYVENFYVRIRDHKITGVAAHSDNKMLHCAYKLARNIILDYDRDPEPLDLWYDKASKQGTAVSNFMHSYSKDDDKLNFSIEINHSYSNFFPWYVSFNPSFLRFEADDK